LLLMRYFVRRALLGRSHGI